MATTADLATIPRGAPFHVGPWTTRKASGIGGLEVVTVGELPSDQKIVCHTDSHDVARILLMAPRVETCLRVLACSDTFNRTVFQHVCELDAEIGDLSALPAPWTFGPSTAYYNVVRDANGNEICNMHVWDKVAPATAALLVALPRMRDLIGDVAREGRYTPKHDAVCMELLRAANGLPLTEEPEPEAPAGSFAP
jgi:hypothetical protein